jgi:uncharacterized protein YyaL (SSP411 family)
MASTNKAADSSASSLPKLIAPRLTTRGGSPFPKKVTRPAEAHRKLFEAREECIRPGCDDKVLTSWNGLMLAAFAEAARALDRDDYRLVAEHNADFLLRELDLAGILQ